MHRGADSSLFTDTSPKAQERYTQRLQATPPRVRLERALRLSERARAATMSDVRQSHPGATQSQLDEAFVRRVYGDALADRFVSHRTAR